jgi:hypothetical protein
MISKELEKKLEKYNLILVYKNVSQIEYYERERSLGFLFKDKKCFEDFINGVFAIYVAKSFKSLIDFFEKKKNNFVLILPKHCMTNGFIMYNVKYVFARNYFTELYIIL